MKPTALSYIDKLRVVRNKYELDTLEAFLGKGARTIQKYIKGEIPINSELHAKIDEAFANSEADKPLIIDVKPPRRNLEEQNLMDLMETHKALAYAHKRLSDAHYIIAETNRNLSRVATGQNEVNSFEVLQARQSILAEYLAKIGSGFRFQSYADAIEALSNELIGISDQQTSQAGSVQEQDTQNISRKSP